MSQVEMVWWRKMLLFFALCFLAFGLGFGISATLFGSASLW